MNDEMSPFPAQIRRHMATLDEARPVDPEQSWNTNPADE